MDSSKVCITLFEYISNVYAVYITCRIFSNVYRNNEKFRKFVDSKHVLNIFITYEILFVNYLIKNSNDVFLCISFNKIQAYNTFVHIHVYDIAIYQNIIYF
uniref:Uncharacterized protein n=1 Tax=Sipha flava TaxID=143950 RepID=A0A2S2R6K8_9HEMI